MDTLSDFQDELGWWLSDARDFFKEQKIQKELFNITNFAEAGELDENEVKLIKKVFSETLKLSFILNNSPENVEKLINYLTK